MAADIGRAVERVGSLSDTEKGRIDIEKAAAQAYAKMYHNDMKKVNDALQKLQKKHQEAMQKADEAAAEKRNREIIKAYGTAGEKLKIAGQEAAEHITKSIGNAIKAVGQSVDKYTSLIADNMSRINARIQESGTNFSKIMDKFTANMAVNPFFNYQTLLNNLNAFVNQGVSYNLTQRAFLASISDKIAPTFNALNDSTLQMVRLQQQDTTAQRLGLEANLTRLFNYYFSDTSYLSKQFESVQASLVEISANTAGTAGLETEYTVQKWLGALSSVGASSNLIQSLAQGIGYLGTGNISALSGNESLQNLLVMAMSRSGNLNYGDILTGGLNASQANELLYNVVGYLQTLAGTDNNVLKSAYANIFGFNIADLRAVSNLSPATMSALRGQNLSRAGMDAELEYQLGQVASRTHLSEMIDNIMSNAMATVGISIANNPALYGIYKAADMLESVTGGIAIPSIFAMGTGIDLNTSVEGLIKAGVIGAGVIPTLFSALSGLGQGGPLALSNWGIETNKGGNFGGFTTVGTISNTRSNLAVIGNTDEMGMQQSLIDTGKESAQEMHGEQTSEGDKIIAYLDELVKYLVDGGTQGNPLTVRIDQTGGATFG